MVVDTVVDIVNYIVKDMNLPSLRGAFSSNLISGGVPLYCWTLSLCHMGHQVHYSQYQVHKVRSVSLRWEICRETKYVTR